MSTVGTLYDETIKFGYAKLLQVSTASGASSIDFVAPLALDYDTFWFDLDSLTPSLNSAILIIYVSTNSGSSWQAGTDYYWYTFLVQPGGAGAASYSSTALPETTYMRISQPQSAPAGFYPTDGRVTFNLGPNRGTTGGHRSFDWITINQDPASGYPVASTGGGAYTGTAPNGVRIFFSGGSTITGIIRCYGLKKGSGV